MAENLDKTNPQHESAEDEPIVYAIQKDLKGWKFSRRDFLRGVAATAEVAAVAGAVTGCGSPPTQEVAAPKPAPTLSPKEKLVACQDVKAHSGAVKALAASADGKLLVSGSSDNTIKLWSLPDGALVKALEADMEAVDVLVMSPDGKLVVGNFQTFKLWSLATGELIKTWQGTERKKSDITTLAVSPDGKLLASGSHDKTIKLWLLPEGKRIKTLEGHNRSVTALAISPNGKLLASGGEDKTIKLWSLPEGELAVTLQKHTDTVYILVVSLDGKLLASASGDKTIKLWSLPEGVLVKTLEGHKGPIKALAMSPDGKLLASGSWDRTIKLWSLPDGALLKTMDGRNLDEIIALAVSPDGKLLASGSKDKTIKLWSLPEGEFVSCLIDLSSNEPDVSGITYEVKNASGQTIQYTLPCGSPIPLGAVCVCNCVSGNRSAPSTCGCVGYSSYWYPN